MSVQTVRIGHEKAFLTLSDEYDNVTTRSHSGLWGVRARLRVPSLESSALVYLSDSPPQATALPAFFAALAADWRGWSGSREWAAFAGGLTLACTHDDRGTVAMGAELRDQNLGWVARAIVPIDCGGLEQLAADVAAFFAG
jgi:hypothetical protein